MTFVADHREKIGNLKRIRIHVRTHSKARKNLGVLRRVTVMLGEIGFVAGKQFENSAVGFNSIFRVVLRLDAADVAGNPDLEGSFQRGHVAVEE